MDFSVKSFACTKKRLFGFICGALLPVMTIGLGIFMLNKNAVPNSGIAITFFLIPVIAAVFLGLCVFSDCTITKKVVFSVVILVLFSVLFGISAFFTTLTQVDRYEGENAGEQYASLKSKSGMMPELSLLGETEELEYYHVLSSFAIFSEEADYLACRYTKEDYEIRKTQLDAEYTFQTETITGRGNNCEPAVEIDGYQFRMLSVKKYGLSYPEELVLIGCSDDACEIIYLEFYSFDLDYIPSLKEFITDDCGWKYIR